LPIRVEEANDALWLLERLNQPIQQDPIKGAIMPTDDAFVVFIEGVHDQPPVNTVSPGYSLNPPYKSSGEADRGQVISRQPVVAGCDAPEVLQPVERALDAPAQLVDALIEAERLLPVAAIWNDQLGSALVQVFAQQRYRRLCRRASVSTASLCELGALRPGNRALHLRSTGWR
jgi:hypothetical protein